MKSLQKSKLKQDKLKHKYDHSIAQQQITKKKINKLQIAHTELESKYDMECKKFSYLSWNYADCRLDSEY